MQLTAIVDLQAKKTGTGTSGPVTVKQVKKQDVATADDKEEITAEEEVSINGPEGAFTCALGQHAWSANLLWTAYAVPHSPALSACNLDAAIMNCCADVVLCRGLMAASALLHCIAHSQWQLPDSCWLPLFRTR